MSALRTRAVIGSVFLAVAAPVILTGTAQAAAPTDCDDFQAEISQVYRTNNGTNLITRSAQELQTAKAYGFTDDQGTLAKVSSTDGAGLVPIWRMYRPGDFVWATEGSAADAYAAEGYGRQFVEFYAASEDNGCLDPIRNYERNGLHRLAGSAGADELLAAGWKADGIAFYALTDKTPTPAPPPAGDTKFSIAVIPDTQNEVVNPLDTRMRNRNNWLADNKSALDLRYALQIGDLVNWGSVVPSQFDKASTDMKSLEAAMPWAGAIGNHDTGAVCIGGSACVGQNANIAVRDTTAYNKAFPVSRFPNVKGTFEPNKIDNAYATFSAGGVQWMALTLELWPRTSVVNWAKEVVASHPNHNVIVVTHAYLDGDGSISSSNGGYGANSPKYLYDNLIKVYPNVKLVLSGHVGQAADRTDVGVNGNKILSLLQTYHSATNPVRTVEIDTAAGTVTSEVYAPLTRTEYPGDATSTNGLVFS